MSKPWRMVTLHLGAWLALGYSWWNGGPRFPGPFTILDWTCLVVVAGCLQTIAVRLRKIMAALRARSA
jgi:hypothetical protein